MAIHSAFKDYLAILAANKEYECGEDGSLNIFRDPMRKIRELVEKCERTFEFRNLVKKTRRDYAKRPDRERYDIWQTSVGHVLRRSKIYADVLDSDYCPDHLFKRFEDAIAGKKVPAVILAPLESVEFSADSPLDFGSFAIRKFSREELSTITENDTRALFYGESVLDIRLLSHYWWLTVPYVPDPRYPGQVYKIEILRPPVERQYSTFPPAVERVLQTLVLYDWDTNLSGDRDNEHRYSLLEDHRRWLGFHVPFVMHCGGSLFRPPVQPPDISRLALQPLFNDDGDESGVCPQPPIHNLHHKETRGFSRIVAKYENQLKKIRTQADKWSFIDVAISHLVKAFFAFELDQLLWHTVAIEALLGEPTPGRLKDTLASRCGCVLGCTKAGRATIDRSFRKTYDLRSDVVHGNTKLKEIHSGHLTVVRYIARDATVWFLDYLYHIAQGFQPNDERLPHRRELLSALDIRPDARKRISHLLSRVPVDFPSSECWDET